MVDLLSHLDVSLNAKIRILKQIITHACVDAIGGARLNRSTLFLLNILNE